MQVLKNAQHQSQQGSPDWFSGTVHIDSLFAQQEPAYVSGGRVTFQPQARTAWHTHPLGQILLVTAGLGYVQKWGEPRQMIQPGDIVVIAPNEKHWHGASEQQFMTHIALQEAQ